MSQRDGSRQFLGCSQDVFSPHGEEDFCTRDNWQVGSSQGHHHNYHHHHIIMLVMCQVAVVHLAQEMELLGLASPCTKAADSQEGGQVSCDWLTADT